MVTEAFIQLIPFMSLDPVSVVIFKILWYILCIQAADTPNLDSETVREH